MLTMAFYVGMLHHWDPKKYPKLPEELWNASVADQTLDQMKAMALAWADNGSEHREGAA
jgi:hypothetical protein